MSFSFTSTPDGSDIKSENEKHTQMSGGYSCEQCGEQFETSQQLGGHMNKHYAEPEISDDELVAEIQRVAAELDRAPTVTEIEEISDYTTAPYRRAFGTVAKAREAAGFDVEPYLAGKATKEDLLEEIKRLHEKNGVVPTHTTIRDESEHSLKAFINRFGTWTDALNEAGLSPRSRNCLSEEQLLDELRELAAELGKTPTQGEMAEHGKSGSTTYRSRFGSWNEALQKAGLQTNHEMNVQVEVECSLCGDQTLKKPSRLEMYEKHFCSQDCYIRHRRENPFLAGEDNPNWNGGEQEVECSVCGDSLLRIPFYIENNENFFCSTDCRAEWQSENYIGQDHPAWNGGDIPYGPGWTEDKRRAVRKRDGHECAICGLSQSEHRDRYNERLHVHHIQPAREFEKDNPAKNEMENLITLCNPCHSRWEGIPLRPQAAD